jgi:hypothetical protein
MTDTQRDKAMTDWFHSTEGMNANSWNNSFQHTANENFKAGYQAALTVSSEPVGYVRAERNALNTCDKNGNVIMILRAYLHTEANGYSGKGVKNGDLLYTTLQPDRVAELEAKLEIAKKALELYARQGWETGWEFAVEALKQIGVNDDYI